jgi:thioredoxin 1
MQTLLLKINTYIFIFILFLSIATAAEPSKEDPGIQFLDISWQRALRIAESENKLIFVDFYTEWCGVCKRQKRRTFPDAQVGILFNHQFINLALDMEKGEGKILAEIYEVRQHPTLLFINARGEVVEQGTGFHNAQKLIELGQSALSK